MTQTSPVPKKQEQSTLTFPQAIAAVIDGHRVTKTEWGDANIYVSMLDGYLRIHRDDGIHYKLSVSEGDMVGADWYVLE